VALLTLAGERAALAIEACPVVRARARFAQELQRSLLPVELPRLPGITTAARYLPGGGVAQVGGDWYDVIGLPEGQLLLVMGGTSRAGGVGAAPR
jgi:serine phosphatase RsbU (regulator of sigma subunit)